MATGRRGISAQQLADDYAMSVNRFAEEVVTLLAKLGDDEVRAPPAERCRESCGAVWAAVKAALESSSLTTDESARFTPLLLGVLIPFWRKHCAMDADIPALLEERAAFYLLSRDPASQIKTAAQLVNRLLETIGVAQGARTSTATTLTAAFAHRMLGDIHRINDVRARFGIDLPLIAVLTALMPATMSYEPVLRILRLA